MLIPMMVLAAVCVLFGVVNSIPIVGLIQPAVGEAILEGHSFAGFPPNTVLVGLTVAVLLAAVLNHWYGVRRTGRGLGAVDHIHHAPGAAQVYAVAEAGKIDPYRIGRWIVKGFGYALWGIDRAVDWVTETATVAVAGGASLLARRAHNGNLNRYVLWSLAGAGAVTAIAILVFGGAR
jgi:NADH-quinone oxidoreductase subunit L